MKKFSGHGVKEGELHHKIGDCCECRHEGMPFRLKYVKALYAPDNLYACSDHWMIYDPEGECYWGQFEDGVGGKQ